MTTQRALALKVIALIAISYMCVLSVFAQQVSDKRKIIIDQDAAGPAGTDQQSMLLLIQSPQTQVLGITVVTGDAWLKSEVAHTLRMLEIIGRTDIPVVAGAEYPLVRRKDETELWEQIYGPVAWLGAWTPRLYHPADQLGEMPEGTPTTKPLDEDAAQRVHRNDFERGDLDLIARVGQSTGVIHRLSRKVALAREQAAQSHGGGFHPGAA